MKKKHFVILMVDKFDPVLCAGNQLSTFEIARFIKSKGNSVEIINYYTDGPLGRRVFEELKPKGLKTDHFDYLNEGIKIYVELLKFKEHELAGNHKTLIFKLIKKIEKQRPDYILTMENDLLSLAAGTIAGIRGGVFFHSHYYLGSYRSAGPYFLNMLKHRDRYCVSESIGRLAKKTLGLECVLWNPIIDEKKITVKKSSEPRKVVGFYSEYLKGNEIVERLALELPDYKFAVIGRNCGVNAAAGKGNIKLLGAVNNVKPFYREIGLLVAPSVVLEGYGRIVIEAMANGIPAIANSIGGLAEAVSDAGILVEIKLGDVNVERAAGKYSGLIRSIVENKSLYRSYSLKALKRARKYFSAQDLMNNRIYSRYIFPERALRTGNPGKSK